MLSEFKLKHLQELLKDISKEELIWVNGYISAHLHQSTGHIAIGNTAATVASSTAPSPKPLIVYATETGNAKRVATQLLSFLKKEKVQAKSIDIATLDVERLADEQYVLFIISTQGEGELPQTALAFYDALKKTALKLNNVSFAVFALGDNSYPLFCQAGVLLDETLTEKGATHLLPLQKSDIDFVPVAQEWQTQVWKQLQSQASAHSVAKATTSTISSSASTSHTKVHYQGEIAERIILNDRGSQKSTYHIEIQTNDVLDYEPGDALGVVPTNTDEDIDALLRVFNEKRDTSMTLQAQQQTAYAWLQTKNIKGLSKNQIQKILSIFSLEEKEQVQIETQLQDKADLIDVLHCVPKKNQDTVQWEHILPSLHAIAPRLYSISSAPSYHENQIHLTVNLNHFQSHVNGESLAKVGLASQYLAQYPLGRTLSFYIHKNPYFRLPQEDKDVIMIGPGTGIAPFRSFLAQRDATGASGRNWLFFGEQHFALDFYYQTEIQEWLATGLLTRLDTAFSRDQAHKIYVQHRLKQKAQDIYAWLQAGAHLYVCGQKNPMSLDVEQTLIEIMAQEGQQSIEQAKQALEILEEQGRYVKDVY